MSRTSATSGGTIHTGADARRKEPIQGRRSRIAGKSTRSNNAGPVNRIRWEHVSGAAVIQRVAINP